MVQSFAEHMVLEQELRALYTEPQVGRQAERLGLERPHLLILFT